jgi:NAD(P)-dependent dehydrogenase (short-subunit alcohol dehydrogenase family)
MFFSRGKWTSDDMPDMEGETVIVTGANSGLGFEATKKFSEKNARLVMACRSLEKGKEAKEKIEKELEDPELEVRRIDLADLESVKNFAKEFRANNDELHVLCNNAGVMAVPRSETEDGFEQQFGVNHLGHFALTGHLIEVLEDTEGETRVVTQSSMLHKNGEINFDDLMMEEDYDKWDAYAQSKLANVLFGYELDRKLRRENSRVKSVVCHPGFASTNLQYRGPEEEGSKLKLWMMKAANTVVAQDAEKGALPMLYAATSEKIEGGEYIGPDGLKNMRGYPEEQESSLESQDKDVAEALWNRSEVLTDVDFEL